MLGYVFTIYNLPAADMFLPRESLLRAAAGLPNDSCPPGSLVQTGLIDAEFADDSYLFGMLQYCTKLYALFKSMGSSLVIRPHDGKFDFILLNDPSLTPQARVLGNYIDREYDTHVRKVKMLSAINNIRLMNAALSLTERKVYVVGHVRAAGLFGCETRPWNAAEILELQRIENDIVRRQVGFRRWMHEKFHINMQKIRRDNLIDPLVSYIRFMQLSFIGHVVRRTQRRLARRLLLGVVLPSSGDPLDIAAAISAHPRHQETLWDQGLKTLSRFFPNMTGAKMYSTARIANQWAFVIRKVRLDILMADFDGGGQWASGERRRTMDIIWQKFASGVDLAIPGGCGGPVEYALRHPWMSRFYDRTIPVSHGHASVRSLLHDGRSIGGPSDDVYSSALNLIDWDKVDRICNDVENGFKNSSVRLLRGLASLAAPLGVRTPSPKRGHRVRFTPDTIHSVKLNIIDNDPCIDAFSSAVASVGHGYVCSCDLCGVNGNCFYSEVSVFRHVCDSRHHRAVSGVAAALGLQLWVRPAGAGASGPAPPKKEKIFGGGSKHDNKVLTDEGRHLPRGLTWKSKPNGVECDRRQIIINSSSVFVPEADRKVRIQKTVTLSHFEDEEAAIEHAAQMLLDIERSPKRHLRDQNSRRWRLAEIQISSSDSDSGSGG